MTDQLNSLIVEGKLERDPVRRGNGVVFTVASRHCFKDESGRRQAETSYFEAEAWGNPAKAVLRHKAGDGLRLVGRLRQKQWTSDSGLKCSSVVIAAEYVEFKRKPETDKENVPESF